MVMKDAYSTQELAQLSGVTPRAVLDRAKREGWQFRPRSGRGGGKEWLVASILKGVKGNGDEGRVQHARDSCTAWNNKAVS